MIILRTGNSLTGDRESAGNSMPVSAGTATAENDDLRYPAMREAAIVTQRDSISERE
jgi:hypothetical protein